MLPYQQRVVDEKDALDSKIDRLIAFINSEAFSSLPVADQVDLLVQQGQMISYTSTLSRRIARF